MSETFLHGVQMVEVDTGARPIRTVTTAIIGLVGTAPNADPAVFPLNTPVVIAGSREKAKSLKVDKAVSTFTVDATANTFTKAGHGFVTGQGVKLTVATGGTLPGGTALNTIYYVGVTGDAIKLYSTRSGAVEASSGQVIDLANTGSGVLTMTVQHFLVGQESVESQPCGSLPFAVEAILQQVGAVIVVVRVADGTGISDGLDVLKTAKGVTGYEPRILSALWFGEVGDGIAVKLAQVTDELRACSAANYNSPTDSESEADGGAIGTARVKILGPSKLRMSMFGGIYEIHASAAWAGLRAKVDYEQGFWVSESNKVIAGVVSISNLPTWSIGDPASEANQLNEKNVTTFIRENGFRVWGNRGANGDFQSVQRTRDIINDSVQRAHLWAVDRNIVKTYFEDVTEGVNAYLRNLISLGAITGGTCWPDPDLNTPQNIAQGKVYFNFDIGFAYPAEHVIFQSFINDDYLNNLLK